jgi:hypothetical protein
MALVKSTSAMMCRWEIPARLPVGSAVDQQAASLFQETLELMGVGRAGEDRGRSLNMADKVEVPACSVSPS